MPANVSYEYTNAEKKYYAAKNDEEKLAALEEMISTMPSHKGAENLRADLRSRYKKLKEKIEAQKKHGKGKGKPGIKKAELQAVLIGLTNSGKSSLLDILTNCNPKISPIQFTTKEPNLGTLDYDSVKIQIIDEPAIESEYFDQGIANDADTLLMLITSPEEIKEIDPFLVKTKGERIIVLNKIDLLNDNEKRKIKARLQSKKYNFVAVSTKTQEGIKELKDKLFKSFHVIRIYMKEPKKSPSEIPMILEEGSSVRDVAEKIKHGLSNQVVETRITGPSSKFPNQIVGLNHKVKDKDIIEFKIR
jgi:ribosome-interacting GTPase 1